MDGRGPVHGRLRSGGWTRGSQQVDGEVRMDGNGPANGRKGPTGERYGSDGRRWSGMDAGVREWTQRSQQVDAGVRKWTQGSDAWTAKVRRVDAGSYRWTARSVWATLRPGVNCPLLFQFVTRRSFLRGVRYPGHGTNVSSRVDQALRCVSIFGPGGADE